MSAILFNPPTWQPLTGSAVTYPGALLYFYRTGTTTAQTVYSDYALTTAHAQPVVADAAGIFAPIYLDSSAGFLYKILLTDKDAVTIDTVDPITATSSFVSTDAGATGGPDVVIDRDSASAADNDVLGRLIYRGNDDAAADNDYAMIQAEITDASAGSEDGRLSLQTAVAGTLAPALILPAGMQAQACGLLITQDTDTDHDINVASGFAMDSAATTGIWLSAEMTKRIDATWGIGDDAGGDFVTSGSPTASTRYYFFLIRRSDTGVVDAGFDTSITAANIPTGYDAYALIGEVLLDASSNIAHWTSYDKSNRVAQTVTNHNDGGRYFPFTGSTAAALFDIDSLLDGAGTFASFGPTGTGTNDIADMDNIPSTTVAVVFGFSIVGDSGTAGAVNVFARPGSVAWASGAGQTSKIGSLSVDTVLKETAGEFTVGLDPADLTFDMAITESTATNVNIKIWLKGFYS